MVKIEINGVERYYDGYLKDNLDIIKQAVVLKWDGVLFVSGYEGDGKSVLAAQVALYFDPTYELARCVFTPQQFMDAVDHATPGQAIVYDEAQDAFESTNRDEQSRAIKSKMTRIRKKGLFIIIVAPDFWRINKYLFIHRSRCFIRVYAEGLTRGFFEFYNREKKHQLYIEGKRHEKILVQANFRGRFTKWFPLDEDDYDHKKDAATHNVGKPTSQGQHLRDLAAAETRGKALALQGLAKAKVLSFKRGCEVLGVHSRTLYDALKRIHTEYERGGGVLTSEARGNLISNLHEGSAAAASEEGDDDS